MHNNVTAALSRPALIVILGWFFAGAALMVATLGGVEVNPALAPIDPVQKLVIGAALAAGATLISLAALHWRRASTSWQLELFALPTLIGAWALYTVCVVAADNMAVFQGALGLSFAAACITRLIEVLRVTYRTRRNVEDLPPEVRPDAR